MNKESLASTKSNFFEILAEKVSTATGSTPAIIIAFLIVLAWAICGPIFHYSENWQLIINTGTTIITFLMVFLIQKSQNKESMATQLKLNELVAAHELASNRLVDVENMTEDELKRIHEYYCSLKDKTQKEESLQKSHSIDEAEHMHQLKKDAEKKIKTDLKKK